jgi:hypothetical protein
VSFIPKDSEKVSIRIPIWIPKEKTLYKTLKIS